MSRRGKIARLPKIIRTQLNTRLEDGQSGETILHWVNELEPVKTVLVEEFSGQPISHQNLSDWREGGYQDWIRNEEAKGVVRSWLESGAELEEETEADLADAFATVLAAEMIALAKLLLDKEADPELRWQRMRELSREISRIRRDDHQQHWTNLKDADAEREAELQEEAAQQAELKKMQEDHEKGLRSAAMAQTIVGHLAHELGGGKKAFAWARTFSEAQFNLPLGFLTGKGEFKWDVEMGRWMAKEGVKKVRMTKCATGPLTPTLSPDGGEGDGKSSASQS